MISKKNKLSEDIRKEDNFLNQIVPLTHSNFADTNLTPLINSSKLSSCSPTEILYV